MPRKTSSPLLLVTRPEPSASETAAQLCAAGYATLISPALKAIALPPRDLALGMGEQLIVTSPQAARFLNKWPQLHGYPVWAVGHRTAGLLAAAGFKHVRHDGNEDAASLVRSIGTGHKYSFCLLGAPTTGRNLQQSLQTDGHKARRAAVYRIETATRLTKAARDGLQAKQITHVLFYSARTAASFLALAAAYDLTRIIALCMSQAVADGMQRSQFAAIRIASSPTSEALQRLLPALG